MERKDENGILKTNIGPIKPDNSKENKDENGILISLKQRIWILELKGK